MPAPSIYVRDENHYHGECVIYVVLDALADEDPKHDRWVEAFKPGRTIEGDLDRIARRMRLDRSDPEQVAARRFPVRVAKVPDPPAICSSCLHFFDRSEAESEQSDV